MTPEESNPKANCANLQSPQTSTAQRMLVVVAIAALVLLTWQLSGVLLLVFGAIILATALRAVATPIERYLRLSPRLAVATAIVLASAMIVAGTWLIGDRLVEQFQDLRQRMPEALAALTIWLNSHPIGLHILGVWDSAKDGDVPWVRVANVATFTVGAIGSIGLVFVLAIYFAVDPAQYRQGLVRLIPPAYRDQINAALDASRQALSKWLMGQGISMLFVGSATGIGLAALGMPLALSLGVIAGVLAFIPFFGPIASGVLAVILAFMQGPTQALYVASLCILIQQIEGNFVMPFVQRWAVELPPVLGIIAALIFGLLFGIVGVVFATPLMVVAMVLVQKLYIEGFLESGSRSSATAT
jgi:predicted PurR-regulated permease PerM